MPKEGDQIVVHYIGTLTDGKKFDSSRDRGAPFTFTVGKGAVIKCWDEGFLKMSVGEVAKLTCSPDYAYGEEGYPGVIPPNAVVIFDAQLIHIKKGSAVGGNSQSVSGNDLMKGLFMGGCAATIGYF